MWQRKELLPPLLTQTMHVTTCHLAVSVPRILHSHFSLFSIRADISNQSHSSYWASECGCVCVCVCFERIFSLKDLHWIPNVDTSYEFSFRFAGAKPSRHSVCLANCRQARKSSSKREPSISISEFSPTHTHTGALTQTHTYTIMPRHVKQAALGARRMGKAASISLPNGVMYDMCESCCTISWLGFSPISNVKSVQREKREPTAWLGMPM